MRIRLIALMIVTVVALSPLMVCGQYSGVWGLPAMPSLFSGPSAYGRSTAEIGPEVYFGWGMLQDRNLSLSLTAQHSGLFDFRSLDIKLPIGGFWLGTAFPVSLTDRLGFVASGWYLFPRDTNANSSEDFTYLVRYSLTNDINAKPIWWYVDGAFTYGSSGFSFLLGLRYDHSALTLTDPSNINALPYPPENLDFISRGWIPFIGFQSAYTDAVQNMKVRILGIPTILGSNYLGLTPRGASKVEYNDINYTGGHFVEIFGEYTRRCFGASQAGVFARWNSTRATNSGSVAVINNPVQRDDYNFSLNRNTWTFGGVVMLDFRMPF